MATGARGEGNVGMYAAAAGVMSALPIPFLDTLLASLALPVLAQEVATQARGLAVTGQRRWRWADKAPEQAQQHQRK